MRIDEDGENGGRGQSLLSLGEALSEPAPAGPSRLAQAIAQVRAEKGIAQPREAAQPAPHHEPPPAPTPRISPLLEALAAEPQAQERPLQPPPADDWPRERSSGAVPPLLAAASQWPEKRPSRPASKVEAEPLPTLNGSDPEPVDDAPPATPIAAAVEAVKAVHAAKETRAEAQPQAATEPARSRQARERLPFPELEPFPMAQRGDAFWDDAARVLGLDDGAPVPASASAPRSSTAPAWQGRAGASAPIGFSAGSVIAGLRRSLRLIIATTLAGTLLGGGAALLTPRTYSSTAELLADGRGVATDGAAQPAMPDEALRTMVENQLRILRSQSLLAEVADRLKLADDPEFDGTAEGMSLSALAKIISGAPGNTDAEQRKLIAAQALARSLVISRDGASFVIDITATTRDADKSALIANTLAETFLATGGQAGAKGAVRVLGDPPSSEAAPVEAPQATRIMSRAMPAMASNPPSRISIIFKGLALGLLVGLGLALLQMVRRHFAASVPQGEAVAHVAAAWPQVAPATSPAEWPAAARRTAVPSRADADGHMSNSPEPVAHLAPEEDRPMQRAPYRRAYEPYPAAQSQDRHQPSPYRQAPMRPAAYAPQPGPAAYPQDAGDPRYAAGPSESYWQHAMPPAPPQHWQQAPQPPHPGQQQMLHPHQYPMQARPQDYAPAMPPQPQPYAPASGYGPYGEPAPAYGQQHIARQPHDPRYADHAPSAYGPQPMGMDERDPRYSDYPQSRSYYGAEPVSGQDPRYAGGSPSAYGPEPMGMGLRDPRYGGPAPRGYAGDPSYEAQNWQAQPPEADRSLEEIRATLRECREAIRDLGDKRTRRRYF